MSVALNPKNRGDLNPLLKWLWDLLSLYSVEEITIPTDYHQQVQEIKDVLRSDVSGLVNSLLDFAIDSALVDFIIETENSNLTKLLNEWLANINENLRGKIPTGIKALAKEYFRERWKSGSLLLLRTEWEQTNGFILPTKLWFVDGANIKVDDNSETRIIGEEKYYLKLTKNEVKLLPSLDNELIFIQKPYSNWSSLYPTPFLIQRGIYKNLKIFELINKKSEKIIGKAMEYMLLVKKGSEALAGKNLPQFIYDKNDLQETKIDLQTTINNAKTEAGTPSYVTNFDTAIEHLIPDYSKAISDSIFSPIEKRILAGLGLIEIVQGVASTRRESILNPKPFVGEVQQAIIDFKSLLVDVLKTIAEKNTGDHRKYFNTDIQIHASPIKAFINEDIRAHLRSMYDRGCLSKQTYIEIVGESVDFTIEVQRRKNESKEKLEEILYPPVIQNVENTPTDLEKIENIPNDKKGLEKLNFKSSVLFGAICKKCNAEFDYQNTPEVQMGGTKCSSCGEMLTDKDIDFSKVFEEAPYNKVSDLPDAVKNNMDSDLAQTFLKVVNDAIKKYKNETTAFKVAWAVIRKIAKKDKDGKWVKKTSKSSIEISNIVDESQDPIEKLIQLKKLELLDKQASLLDELSPKENINEGS